ncbi:hypothetical protein D3C72_2052400 [compost metagenome]
MMARAYFKLALHLPLFMTKGVMNIPQFIEPVFYFGQQGVRGMGGLNTATRRLK